MKVLLICITFSLIVLTSAFLSSSQNHQPLPPMENPHIVIKKKKRLLQIFDGEKLVRKYKIVLGFAPFADKQIEGDGKTPEGTFYVFTKTSRADFTSP